MLSILVLSNLYLYIYLIFSVYTHWPVSYCHHYNCSKSETPIGPAGFQKLAFYWYYLIKVINLKSENSNSNANLLYITYTNIKLYFKQLQNMELAHLR